MKSFSKDERKWIVQQELSLLKDGDYISLETYEDVLQAQRLYYKDLREKESQMVDTANLLESKKVKPVKPKQVKEKKKLTPEQLRERNINWLLNLGVVLLLIGGLFIATSNWETMSEWMKAGSIAIVSVLFYGIAVFSSKILKIAKTAFAFVVLGSLFLPIFLLSIGWYQLIGPYLSVTGEGRYLFGMLSSFAVLPVYVWLAHKLSARLFVWFSYLALSIGTGFLLASFHFGIDLFYLGIMLFNTLLIFLYHRVKAKENIQLFTREFVYFAQVNLILSTVMMLTFFESHVQFGFNLVLTAIVYLAMVYVSGKKEFHFVFSGMLVYAVYQLVEFSVLEAFSPIIYALLGFGFLFIPKALDEQYAWKQIFNVTSGVVTGAAFLYITFEGIILKWGEPSFILMLAYFVIAANFLYLSNMMKKRLFRYLTPIFVSVGLFEAVSLLDQVFYFEESFVLWLFLIGFTIFVVFGTLLQGPFFKVINQSSRDVGLAYMLLFSFVALTISIWWELGLMLILLAVCSVLTLKYESRTLYIRASEWMFPITTGFAFVAFAEEVRQFSFFYREQLGVATDYMIASVLVLISYYLLKNETLKRNSFYLSQVYYTIALLFSFIFPIDEIWVRPLLVLGGIAMYNKLFTFTNNKGFTYLVSSVTLLAYFTILRTIYVLQGLVQSFEYVQLIGGGALLLALAFYFYKKENAQFQAFAVVGHIYTPFALVLTYIFYNEKSLWSFLIAFLMYALSTKIAVKERSIKFFLYSAFTSLFMIFLTGIDMTEAVDKEYAFLLTSIAVVVFWQIGAPAFKERTTLYFVPFSLIGILAFLNIYPYETTPFLVTLFYAIGMIGFLHLVKWDVIVLFPLLFIYGGTLQYLFAHRFGAVNELIVLALFGLASLFAGKLLYKNLYEDSKNILKKSIDVYAIVAFLFFATMYVFQQPTLWTKVLPGLLIVLLIWLQRKRVPVAVQWVPTFIAGGYLLQPYYVFLAEIEIPELVDTETKVLPFIVLVLFLQFCLKEKYRSFTTRLQWAILTIVSIMLVLDGLESSTIYDALILGTLSLLSILAGVFCRMKSYFFIGSGVLLLNVFLQTRPYWGNLPWWGYLLIAGSLLIAVASYNEWQKQKTARGEGTLLLTIKTKIMESLKKWN